MWQSTCFGLLLTDVLSAMGSFFALNSGNFISTKFLPDGCRISLRKLCTSCDKFSLVQGSQIFVKNLVNFSLWFAYHLYFVGDRLTITLFLVLNQGILFSAKPYARFVQSFVNQLNTKGYTTSCKR